MFGKKNAVEHPINKDIKVGDQVVVIAGKDFSHMTPGKPVQGKVLEISKKEGKIIVEKVKMVTKHVKPRKQGDPGGIMQAEGAFYASKVMLWCPECQKGRRVRHVSADGQKGRFCAKCGRSL